LVFGITQLDGSRRPLNKKKNQSCRGKKREDKERPMLLLMADCGRGKKKNAGDRFSGERL